MIVSTPNYVAIIHRLENITSHCYEFYDRRCGVESEESSLFFVCTLSTEYIVIPETVERAALWLCALDISASLGQGFGQTHVAGSKEKNLLWSTDDSDSRDCYSYSLQAWLLVPVVRVWHLNANLLYHSRRGVGHICLQVVGGILCSFATNWLSSLDVCQSLPLSYWTSLFWSALSNSSISRFGCVLLRKVWSLN